MLGEMQGGNRLAVWVSQTSEEDDIGCLAAEKDGRIHLMVYRHLAVRDNGEPVDVEVSLSGTPFAPGSWSIVRGNIIAPHHAGFMHELTADRERVRAELGEDATPLAVAIRVIMANREKYECMSELSQLDPLPELVPDSGDLHFTLSLAGHSVVFLQLDARSRGCE